MRLVALILMLFGIPASLSALSPEFKMTKFGNFVHFQGMPNALFFFKNIQKGDSFELRKALRNLSIDTIILSSPGGLVLEGLQMSGIIHDKGLTTYIPTGGECASACAFMFFAGDTRISDGELGVHQISSGATESKKEEEIGTTEVISQYAVSEIIGFLREYDTPQFVYEKMFQQQEMYYFSREELNQLENKGPKYSRKKLTDMDNFLISFNDFLDLLECANDASVCQPVQLCQFAFEGNSWSSQSDALPFVLEAQKQGLDCTKYKLSAPKVASDPNLVIKIQNELIRLGCAKSENDGNIGYESLDALRLLLNLQPYPGFPPYDTPVTSSFANFQNPLFYEHLISLQSNYCSKSVIITGGYEDGKFITADALRDKIDSDIRFTTFSKKQIELSEWDRWLCDGDQDCLNRIEKEKKPPNIKYVINIELTFQWGKNAAKITLTDVESGYEYPYFFVDVDNMQNWANRDKKLGHKIAEAFFKKVTWNTLDKKEWTEFVDEYDVFAKFQGRVDGIRKKMTANLDVASLMFSELQKDFANYPNDEIIKLHINFGDIYATISQEYDGTNFSDKLIYSNEKYNKAVEFYLKAFELDKNSSYAPEALYKVAEIFSLNGQRDDACDIKRVIWESYPESKYGKQQTLLLFCNTPSE